MAVVIAVITVLYIAKIEVSNVLLIASWFACFVRYMAATVLHASDIKCITFAQWI